VERIALRKYFPFCTDFFPFGRDTMEQDEEDLLALKKLRQKNRTVKEKRIYDKV